MDARKAAPLFVVSLALLGVAACDQQPAPRLLSAAAERPAPKDALADLALSPLTARFAGGLTLLGVSAPKDAKLDDTLAITLLFSVDDVPADDALRVFVHVTVPGGELHVAQKDHAFPAAAGPPSSWRRGDFVVDEFTLPVPRAFPADQLVLRAGLYVGKDRERVTDGVHDGKNRVTVAMVAIAGGPPSFPTLNALRARAPIVIDGKLDDADWARAPRSSAFIRHDGKRAPDHATFVQALYDDDALYVAFTAVDPDVFTPYTKRDDPLYESEAVEIFIDADGDKDVYVELQSAPNDVHFDAAFAGGRRKNFDTSYDVDYQTKTLVDGTLNDPADVDRGFVSEWRVSFAPLRDLPEKPHAGVTWRVNFFRLERIRTGEKVRATEASAWSSPYSGDFHNLDRFGTLRFVD